MDFCCNSTSSGIEIKMTDLSNQITELRATLGKMEIALGNVDVAIVWTDEQGRVQ